MLFRPSAEFNANIFSRPRSNPEPRTASAVCVDGLCSLITGPNASFLLAAIKTKLRNPPRTEVLATRGLARRVPAAEIRPAAPPGDVFNVASFSCGVSQTIRCREIEGLLRQENGYYCCLQEHTHQWLGSDTSRARNACRSPREKQNVEVLNNSVSNDPETHDCPFSNSVEFSGE